MRGQHHQPERGGRQPARAGRPQPEHTQHDARDGTRRHRHRRDEEVARRVRVERGAEAPEVLPHQRRGGRRGGRAEPGQHAIAEPSRRDALGRQHLARDDDRVEDDGQVDAVDEQHGGQQRPGRRVVQSNGRGSDAARARRRRPRRRPRPAPRSRASGESALGNVTCGASAVQCWSAECWRACECRSAWQCGVQLRSAACRHSAPGTPALRHSGTALHGTRHLALGTCYTFPVPFDVDARVIENRRLSSDYNVLSLEAPDIARRHRARAVRDGEARSRHRSAAAPAVFGVRDSARRRPRRSASRFSASASATTTAQIFDAEAGQRVQCLGPLGRAFTLPDPTTRGLDGRRRRRPGAVLDASPRRWPRRGVTLTLFYGGRRDADLFYLDYFERLGVTLVLCTEDGSRGERGRVTHAARTRAGRAAGRRRRAALCLRPRADAGGRRAPGRAVRLPMRGVGGTRHGLRPGRLLQLRRPGQGRHGGFHHVRSCIGGPVFDAATLVWD